MRDLEGNYSDKKVKLSLDMYSYRIKKYIGSYVAAMNGIDALVFTAGVGEFTPLIRELVTNDMEYLGIVLDKNKNLKAKRGEIVDLSSDKSRVKVLIIPTNEELVIAEETQKLIEKPKKI